MSDRTDRGGLPPSGETDPQPAPPVVSEREGRGGIVPPAPTVPYDGPPLLSFAITQTAGDASHLFKTLGAIDLIRAHAGELTSQQIGVLGLLARIEIGIKGPCVNVFTGVFYLPPKFITDASLTYLASAIAHDAYHIELASTGQQWQGAEAEWQCRQFQIAVGAVIGLSAGELAYLASIPRDTTIG